MTTKALLSDLMNDIGSRELLAEIHKQDRQYRATSIEAALNILEVFSGDSRGSRLAQMISNLQLLLGLHACRDGSFVAWSSALFECAVEGGPSQRSWNSLLRLGEVLVLPAFLCTGQCDWPFFIPKHGCSLHPIGEFLRPKYDGPVRARNGCYSREDLVRIPIGDSFICIDELNMAVSSLFLKDYEFPGGLRAYPLAGPSYYDRYHDSGVPQLTQGLWLLRKHWLYGSLLVQSFCSSFFPVCSPSVGQNISVSSERFPGWVIASFDTPLYMAECLVHEASHNYLYALSRFVPLVVTDSLSKYYSPWRPDPRPADGVLHACFVFSNVIDMYIQLALSLGSCALQSRVRLGAEILRMKIALESLRQGHSLTPNGNLLVDQISEKVEKAAKSDLAILSSSDRREIDNHRLTYHARF